LLCRSFLCRIAPKLPARSYRRSDRPPASRSRGPRSAPRMTCRTAPRRTARTGDLARICEPAQKRAPWSARYTESAFSRLLALGLICELAQRRGKLSLRFLARRLRDRVHGSDARIADPSAIVTTNACRCSVDPVTVAVCIRDQRSPFLIAQLHRLHPS